MLTNSDSQYPVEFWLKWLKQDVHYQPRCIMIDNSDTEMAGIWSAYGDDVQVMICHWHIKGAWRKNVAKKVFVRPGDLTHSREVKMMWDEAFNRLDDMLRASTEEGSSWCTTSCSYSVWNTKRIGIWLLFRFILTKSIYLRKKNGVMRGVR
ncbi:hypothetical protein BDB00DRAFT_186732 [Zychaea mexicana]|uniref:uncharacterized protein n=1 Tax=Zychaea mexicana TaxID=64656 RepID=UPI0022FE2359|nr:uncharacterized protein BDB00DRAFT_186732 [Zychaea mexicana]KAI9478922.1 hypothetical protein BDB00DRAFT_186732 [Zychaea mexicana]